MPGGGLTQSGKWKTARSKGKYLFPVEAMSPMFRGKYLAADQRKSSGYRQKAGQPHCIKKTGWCTPSALLATPGGAGIFREVTLIRWPSATTG
ncbi:MAG: hypothetical protein U5L96_09415 [Owenweeksia sp.]|nr:hypothetical protein [Owenweeksia sp.]